MEFTRRQALVKMAVAMGAAFVGPRLLSMDFLRGVAGQGPAFSAADVALFDEIADTILPDTDVPGAKAAKTGTVIALVVRDCFAPAEQEVFVTGLASLLAAYEKRFGMGFAQGKPAERLTFLNEYNRALTRGRPAQRAQESTELRAFRHLKQLSIMGYFTSEIGATQALRFVEVPGGFDGNAPYRKGDRNWFNEVR
jgi:hypothetical protein